MAQSSASAVKTLKKALIPGKTALLIIDMQNDFVSEKGYLGLKGQDLSMVRDTVPAVKGLLDYFRKNKMQVIYTQTAHFRYTNTENWVSRTAQKSLDPSICIPGTWGAEIIDELKPLENEAVVVKHRYDAFLDTDLHVILRAGGVENLIIVGTQTNLCVDTTARTSYMMDYVTVLADDCISTPETDFHRPMLDNFQKNFGYVMTSSEIMSKIDSGN